MIRRFIILVLLLSWGRAPAHAQPDTVAPNAPDAFSVKYSTLNAPYKNWLSARQVIAERCTSCHYAGGPSVDFIKYLNNEIGWVNDQYVVPGNSNGSKLFQYLKGSGFNSPPFGTMPQGQALSSYELRLIRDWIDGLPPGGSNPAPNSPFQKAFSVFQNRCFGCHASWSTYTTDRDWVNAGLVVPQDMGASSVTLRIKYGSKHNAIGSEDMPSPKNGALWQAFTEPEYDLIAAWVNGMNLGGSINPPDVRITPGNIFRGTTDRLRIGDRIYIKNVLLDIFGPTVNSIADTNVFRRLSFFGGPCDSKEIYHTFSNNNQNIQEVRISCTGVDIDDEFAPMVPLYSVLRAGFVEKSCLSSVYLNSAVQYAATQAGGSAASSRWPNPNDLLATYRLFYPGTVPTNEIQAELSSVVNTAQSNFPSNTLQGWRYLLLALCSAPGWQQP